MDKGGTQREFPVKNFVAAVGDCADNPRSLGGGHEAKELGGDGDASQLEKDTGGKEREFTFAKELGGKGDVRHVVKDKGGKKREFTVKKFMAAVGDCADNPRSLGDG